LNIFHSESQFWIGGLWFCKGEIRALEWYYFLLKEIGSKWPTKQFEEDKWACGKYGQY